MADFNWLGVAAAAVAGGLVGFVWYLPRVFGTAWADAFGAEEPRPGGPRSPLSGMFAMNAAAAFVLAVVFRGLGVATLTGALATALLLSVGLAAGAQMTRDRLRGVPGTVALIDGAQTVAAHLAMGVVLVLFG